MWKADSKTYRIGILILFIFVAFIFALNCMGGELQSTWISSPIQVDGKMTEWKDLPKVHFEKESVLVGLCNDDKNLYILFRFGNEASARAIRISGMTLWFDISGKKKKEVGIRYTGGPPLSEMSRPEIMGDRISIIHKGESSEVDVPADGSDGIFASASADYKFFTYEFSIPLNEREGVAYSLGAKSGQVIGIGLEWGDISEEDMQRMREQMGNKMGGGEDKLGGNQEGGNEGGPGRMPGESRSRRGMGPEEGMDPQGGMGQGGPMSGSGPELPEKQQIWLKIVVASPEETSLNGAQGS